MRRSEIDIFDMIFSRLMIDACEVANRSRMDAVIAECHEIAERIGLPHYRWRAASARAMQAGLDIIEPRLAPTINQLVT